MSTFVRRLALFLTGSVVAQGLAAMTGLFLVRWLTVEQYAIYTVATMATGAISVLSNGGANVGFVALIGREWPDHARTTSGLKALAQTRRLLFFWIMPLVAVLVGFLLLRAEAGAVTAVIIVALLAVFWLAEMHSRVVDRVLFFAHQTSRVQMLDAGLALARFAIVAVLFAAGGLNATTAVMAAVVISIGRVFPIRAWVERIAPHRPGPPLPEDVSEVVTGVRRQLPTSAFYVMQGQIVLLILSIHADNVAIAGFGALMRIAALFAPLRALNVAFFVPIAARAKSRIPRTILLLTSLNAIPGLMLVLLAATVPAAIIWLIGPQYADLEDEVLVMAICVTFTFTASTLWTLVSNRGWVKHSIAQIPIGLIWIAIATHFLDLSTISGALFLNAGFSLGPVLVGLTELWRHRK